MCKDYFRASLGDRHYPGLIQINRCHCHHAGTPAATPWPAPDSARRVETSGCPNYHHPAADPGHILLLNILEVFGRAKALSACRLPRGTSEVPLWPLVIRRQRTARSTCHRRAELRTVRGRPFDLDRRPMPRAVERLPPYSSLEPVITDRHVEAAKQHVARRHFEIQSRPKFTKQLVVGRLSEFRPSYPPQPAPGP